MWMSSPGPSLTNPLALAFRLHHILVDHLRIHARRPDWTLRADRTDRASGAYGTNWTGLACRPGWARSAGEAGRANRPLGSGGTSGSGRSGGTCRPGGAGAADKRGCQQQRQNDCKYVTTIAG